jgi:hypothetical protein
MFRIIDGKSSGKTSRLMLLVKEHNGILVCANPYAMREKAHAYGLTGFDIISYSDYLINHNYDFGKECFIDEIDMFLKAVGNNISGYSLSLE